MQDDSLEVWCVEYRKGKKRIGWLDDEEQKITKNKSHITFFTNEEAATQALNKFNNINLDVVGCVKYSTMSVKQFMSF